MHASLPDSEIHLWCAFYAQIDTELLDAYRPLLSDEESAQAARFYFERDRHRYLATRALVRTVLSQYAPVAPEQWVFEKNDYGRPSIGGPTVPDFNFNITHTRDLIVLALARGEIGVDTENARLRNASIGIADRYFAPAEVAELYALPQERQKQRFFEYWTLKESYIKARGMGLAIPLDAFAFLFPSENEIRIEIDPTQNDRPQRWRFWQFSIAEDYLCALCAERTTDVSPRLIAHKIVPLQSTEPMHVAALRTSVA